MNPFVCSSVYLRLLFPSFLNNHLGRAKTLLYSAHLFVCVYNTDYKIKKILNPF